jgi:hypothetical protein
LVSAHHSLSFSLKEKEKEKEKENFKKLCMFVNVV